MNAVNIVMLLCVAVRVGNELVTVNDCVVFVHGHIVRPLNEVIINSVMLAEYDMRRKEPRGWNRSL